MHCATALHCSIIQPEYLCHRVCNGIAKYSIMARMGPCPSHLLLACPSTQIEHLFFFFFVNNRF